MAVVGIFKLLNPLSNYRFCLNQRSIFAYPQRAFSKDAGERVPAHKVSGLTIKEKLSTIPEKPKKPMNSFMVYLSEMKDDILKKNPHYKWKEILREGAILWNATPVATKEKYNEKVKGEYLTYSKDIAEYKSKLSDEQIDLLKEVKVEKQKLKERRVLGKKLRENHKPKRPMSSFLRYCMEECKKHNLKMTSATSDLAIKWKALTKEEKQKYEDEYLIESAHYKVALTDWETEMLLSGKEDLVRKVRPKKPEFDESRLNKLNPEKADVKK